MAFSFVADARAGLVAEVRSGSSALVSGHEAAAIAASFVECGLVLWAVDSVGAPAIASSRVKGEFCSLEGAELWFEQAVAVANIGRRNEAKVVFAILLNRARATADLWVLVKFCIAIASGDSRVVTHALALVGVPNAIAWAIELFEWALLDNHFRLASAIVQIPFFITNASDTSQLCSWMADAVADVFQENENFVSFAAILLLGRWVAFAGAVEQFLVGKGSWAVLGRAVACAGILVESAAILAINDSGALALARIIIQDASILASLDIWAFGNTGANIS